MRMTDGFPEQIELSPIPRPFITSMLSKMDSLDEVKTLLLAFNSIYQKKGQLKYCTAKELTTEEKLAETQKILDSAVKNKILISLCVREEEQTTKLYFVNDRFGKNSLEQARNNYETVITEDDLSEDVGTVTEDMVLSAYEDNIGQLTPMIIEELQIAREECPDSWIIEAIKIAVERNIRKWSYVKAILKKWQAEGKQDGRDKRYSESDPERFLDSSYGSIINS